MNNSPGEPANTRAAAPIPASIAPAAPRRQIVRPAFKAVFQFARFMITLPIVLIRGRRGNIDEVTVYSAHPSFFLWLLIVVGFVSAAIVERSPDWAGFFGWFYVWVLLYFLVTLLYDFSARKLGLWVLIFALIWLASKYVELLKHVAVLSSAVRVSCQLAAEARSRHRDGAELAAAVAVDRIAAAHGAQRPQEVHAQRNRRVPFRRRERTDRSHAACGFAPSIATCWKRFSRSAAATCWPSTITRTSSSAGTTSSACSSSGKTSTACCTSVRR